jgi:hypothetical protein
LADTAPLSDLDFLRTESAGSFPAADAARRRPAWRWFRRGSEQRAGRHRVWRSVVIVIAILAVGFVLGLIGGAISGIA